MAGIEKERLQDVIFGLPKLDPRHFILYTGSGDIGFMQDGDEWGGISIGDDGHPQGSNALLFMQCSMFARFKELQAKTSMGIADGFSFAEQEEFRILRQIAMKRAYELTTSLVVRVYAKWKGLLNA